MKNAFMEIELTDVQDLLKGKTPENRKKFLMDLFTAIFENSEDFTPDDLTDLKKLIEKFSKDLTDAEKISYNEKLIKGHQRATFTEPNNKRKLNIIWS